MTLMGVYGELGYYNQLVVFKVRDLLDLAASVSTWPGLRIFGRGLHNLSKEANEGMLFKALPCCLCSPNTSAGLVCDSLEQQRAGLGEAPPPIRDGKKQNPGV